MDKLLMLNILLSQFNYEYNSEYENLSDEEKVYMDYVDMCLNDPNEKFCDACSKAMLLILKIISKIDIEEELSKYDDLRKGKIVIVNGMAYKNRKKKQIWVVS